MTFFLSEHLFVEGEAHWKSKSFLLDEIPIRHEGTKKTKTHEVNLISCDFSS
jgi:hypothetical protein